MGKNKGLDSLHLYRAPRVGALVLACEKCQRKLLESGRGRRLAKLQAALDSAASEATSPLRILEASCMKECPKDGITLCALVAGDQTLPHPVVVRTAEDVATFFALDVAPPAATSLPSDRPVVSEAGLEPATVSLEG